LYIILHKCRTWSVALKKEHLLSVEAKCYEEYLGPREKENISSHIVIPTGETCRMLGEHPRKMIA
jgi:hypothetical protein